MNLLNPWLAGLAFVAICCAGTARITWKYCEGEHAKETVKVQEKKLEVERAATKQHREQELRQNAIDVDLQKTRKERDELKAADRKRALDGELRLRVPGICPAAAPDATADPGQRNAGATDEGVLPREITANLLDFANEADAVSDTLRACRQLAISDRA